MFFKQNFKKLDTDFLSEACCNYQHLFAILCYIITVKSIPGVSWTGAQTNFLKSLWKRIRKDLMKCQSANAFL